MKDWKENPTKRTPDVVIMAYQVIRMQETILEQERELENLREYKDKYNELLNSSLRNSQEMTASWIQAIVDKKITVNS